VGKKDKNKRNEKTEEAYFCQVFPGLVIVSVLSRFVWIRLSFVWEPQFQTLSISAFENAIF
jgi:hypothetical protein